MTKSTTIIKKGDVLRINESSNFRDYKISEDSIFVVEDISIQDNLYYIRKIYGVSTTLKYCLWIDDSNIVKILTDEESDLYLDTDRFNV